MHPSTALTRTTLVLAALGLSGWLLGPPAARAADASLDAALRRQAPEVIRYLRQKGYHEVGVLKFRVKVGDAAATDNVGPLNLDVAERLELALLLATPDESLGILHDASGTLVRNHNHRANHLLREGRLACFDTRYAHAYGDGRPVAADAFVTGFIKLTADLQTTRVCLMAFGRDGNLEPVGKPFEVPTDARTLIETGASYALSEGKVDELVSKGFGDGGKLQFNRAAATAASATTTVKTTLTATTVKTTPAGTVVKTPGADAAPTPVLDPKDVSVQVEILYNGEVVPIENRGGRPTVREPLPGDQVAFRLKNVSKDRCGVVLMINGENTVLRQKGDPAQCKKWILEAGQVGLITGYQLNGEQEARFEILPPDESARDEINYKEHAGTFTVAVFREAPQAAAPAAPPPEQRTAAAPPPAPKGQQPPADLPKDAPPGAGATTAKADDEAIADRVIPKGLGALPSTRPGTLAALQDALRAAARDPRDKGEFVGKGLVVPGQVVHGPANEVSFTPLPTPVQVMTIRYYQPKGS